MKSSWGQPGTPKAKESLQTVRVKKTIQQALDGIEADGDFACFREVDGALNPGLHVSGLGPIGLPLSSREAKALIDICHRSPFGKGSETLVDTSVRKCWELDAKQFDLKHPGWEDELWKITADVADKLGVLSPAENIRAERYKLLIYEEGAFFLPHEDSPKADRMFGTLVVCLPSLHEGGDVVLTHDGKSHTFQSSENSEFGASYSAWYSDVTHEIKPVTSGYRLVITYNLIQDGVGKIPSAPETSTTELESSLKYWNSMCDISPEVDLPKFLAYKLSHKYPSSGLGFGCLKGRDQQRILRLQTVGEKLGFSTLLANVERTVYGGCDDDGYGGYNSRYGFHNTEDFHDLTEVFDDEITIKTAIDQDGLVAAKDLKLGLGDFVQSDPFKGDPDSEDYSGFTGNEGVSATHFYRKTVAIIFPKRYKLTFRYLNVKSDAGELYSWLDRLVTGILEPENRDEFKVLSSLILEDAEWLGNMRRQRKEYNGPKVSLNAILERIAKGCIHIAEFGHFETAIWMHVDSISPSLFTCISDACYRLDKAVLKERGNIQAKFDAVEDLVDTSLPTLQVDDADKLERWRDEQHISLLSAESFVNKNLENGPFVVSFTTSLSERAQAGNIDTAKAQDLYRTIFHKIVAEFSFDKALLNRRPNVGSYAPYSGDYYGFGPGQPKELSGADILTLIKQCEALEIPSSPILTKLKACTLTISNPDITFHNTLLPLVREIVTLMNSKDEATKLSDIFYSVFVKDIIVLYKSLYVQGEPRRPTNMIRPTTSGCPCGDCKTLNSFLSDPVVQVYDFRMAQHRRDHLEQVLSSTVKRETIRAGSPHTLRLTKTEKAFERDHQAWKSRVVKSAQSIRGLGSKVSMEATLSAGFYQMALMPGGLVKPRGELELAYRPQGLLETPNNVVAGLKRKSEEPDERPGKVAVIDLT
ncbi:hypothetical protein AJ80_06953 [Polytolypa hystricis UAMH7299]|uniref:Prolyl 4-hydroxylase alpha subunit Fe(2+) 2OG dioxygenase domain-containing protein n=1 Tax=Polytolypa hystricis (strain UAMH7299) TaxID=1447883 RepID=A0A2B7XTH8_POLH7|nr:hypothetical protein AJ80_06953 [Polytolypa hystricis UAMH7299]